MIVQMFRTMLHIIVCYFLVIERDLGLAGLGIASSASNFLAFALTLLYIVCSRDYRKVVVWPTCESALS